MNAPPTMVALELLDDTIPTIRRIAPPAEADEALLRTVQAFGIIQPILVRPSGNRFEIVKGRRRVIAAAAAGLKEIAALVRQMTLAEALQAQAIAQEQRALLHPIDIWRATKDMIDAGLSIADAALALGLDERQARRNERLAQLHPDLLKLVEREMPESSELAAIAAAPLERQAEALKVRHGVVGDTVNWHLVAAACRQETIARGMAIFDVTKSAIVFEEDWFAQPGSPEQFITRDVAGFLEAQRAALKDRVAKATKRGERLRIADFGRNGLVLPRGWTPRYDGNDKPLKKPDGPVRFVAISDRMWELGKIVEQVADPPRPAAFVSAAAPAQPAAPLRAPAAPTAAAPADTSSIEDVPEELERSPITKKGQQMIAAAKTDALRRRMRERGPELSAELLLAFLVLTLAAENVRVQSGRFGFENLADLPPRLVDVAGHITVAEVEVRQLAADALARALEVTDPVTFSGSGKVAEWIGHALGADNALQRFDTEEFLSQLSGDELRSLARSLDLSLPKKVSELRTALVGHAPDWRPTAFGAPGPKPAAPRRPRRAPMEEEESVG